ncbi:hypothetical protein SCLCIDRAFT_285493 [Scleroderma citrinum Foug A]|uniref:RNase III domain-containing protein n=1 Tax=Scleroderma citrinum Foug A TaxID=1036808 RepID=A0A0C3DHC0_9AGAM|nr:hypothetical protein SCLCIDRAFT_285493 [Scleroderma citrinum Foug A]
MSRLLASPRTRLRLTRGIASSAVDSPFSAHLNSVFAPLQFPPELAKRILTHGSHKEAIHGHNGRLAFVGRRVLESYYLLFIHGAVKGSPHNHDYDALVSRALNTSVLGEHVAPRWSLGAALRWTPPISRDTIQAAQGHLPDADLTDALAANPAVVRSVGLYKVMGEAVQAVVGGVYHQFGGAAAHRLFHTQILPHILLPDDRGGVPMAFHDKAMSICEQVGGSTEDPSC